MNKLIKTAILLMVIAALSAGCQSGQTSGKGYTASIVRLQEHDTYNGNFFRLMQRTGILEKHLPDDVKVEFQWIGQPADARDALVTNNLDFAAIGAAAAISAVENGLPLVLVSNTTYTTTKVYSNNPAIVKLNDVSPNDKIAIVFLGSHYELTLMSYAQDHYGDYKKFANNMLVMPTAETLVSLASSGELACAVLGFPQTIQAEKMENLTEIADLTPYLRSSGMSSLIVTSEAFSKENPALVAAVSQAAKETIDWVNANPDKAAELLSSIMKIDAADIAALIKAAPLSYEFSESAYNTLAGLMYKSGVIPNPPKNFSELPNYASIPKMQ